MIRPTESLAIVVTVYLLQCHFSSPLVLIRTFSVLIKNWFAIWLYFCFCLVIWTSDEHVRFFFTRMYRDGHGVSTERQNEQKKNTSKGTGIGKGMQHEQIIVNNLSWQEFIQLWPELLQIALHSIPHYWRGWNTRVEVVFATPCIACTWVTFIHTHLSISTLPRASWGQHRPSPLALPEFFMRTEPPTTWPAALTRVCDSGGMAECARRVWMWRGKNDSRFRAWARRGTTLWIIHAKDVRSFV